MESSNKFFIVRVGNKIGKIAHYPNTPKNHFLIKSQQNEKVIKMQIAYFAGAYKEISTKQNHLTITNIKDIETKTHKIKINQCEEIARLLNVKNSLNESLTKINKKLTDLSEQIWQHI